MVECLLGARHSHSLKKIGTCQVPTTVPLKLHKTATIVMRFTNTIGFLKGKYRVILTQELALQMEKNQDSRE